MLKLAGATFLACFGFRYLYVEWTRPSSTLQPSGAAATAPGAPLPFPQGEVHAMMQRGDVNSLKKLINDAGDHRTEWCLCMLETAISAKGDVSLDFALDGLEERIGPNGSQHWQRFDTIVRSINFMPPQVQADLLLHVKRFSSDPKKIADVQFWHRTIFEHKALRDAVIKACANNMPEEFMRELLWQCQSPNDWQSLGELFKDQDKRTRSALISQLAVSGSAVWKSSSLPSILNLCDQQALNEIADHCIKSRLNDPLETLLAAGAKVTFQPTEISEISKTHPKVWKEIVATLTQEDLEKLWWEGVQNVQLDELKLWGDKLKLVIDVPKRLSNDYGVTALEHLVLRTERWETCEWLIQQKAKPPKSDQIVTKLFLAVALDQRNQLKNLIASLNSKEFTIYSKDVPRDLLRSAIRMGHSEACGILTQAFAKQGPNDSVLYAIERKQWACIQEMLNNGHQLQNDEMRAISEKAPGGIAGIMADVNSEISPKSFSLLIESAIDRNDEAGLTIAMEKARKLSDTARKDKARNDKERKDNGVVSLEDLLGKDETKRLVDLAISHPRSLAILQFQGFAIDFEHLLNSVRDGDVQATEVCLRSILMMEMSESDRRQLKEEVVQSQSSEIRELFADLGFSPLDAP